LAAIQIDPVVIPDVQANLFFETGLLSNLLAEAALASAD